MEGESDCMVPVGSLWKIYVDRVVRLKPFQSVRVMELVVDSSDYNNAFQSIIDTLRKDGWECSITEKLCEWGDAICTRKLVFKLPVTIEGKPLEEELAVGVLRVGYLFLMP